MHAFESAAFLFSVDKFRLMSLIYKIVTLFDNNPEVINHWFCFCSVVRFISLLKVVSLTGL